MSAPQAEGAVDRRQFDLLGSPSILRNAVAMFSGENGYTSEGNCKRPWSTLTERDLVCEKARELITGRCTLDP